MFCSLDRDLWRGRTSIRKLRLLLALYGYDDLGKDVLAFFLEVRCTLIEAGQGFLVENEETGHPSGLVLLRRYLSHQVIHQLDAVVHWFIMFCAQIYRGS